MQLPRFLPSAQVLQAWTMAGEYKPWQSVQVEGAVTQEPRPTGKQLWGCNCVWSRATCHVQPPWGQQEKLWQQQEGTWKLNEKIDLCRVKWEYWGNATLRVLCCAHIHNNMHTWAVLNTYHPEIITGNRGLVVSVFVLHYRHEPLDKVEVSGLRFVKAWKNNYALSSVVHSSTKQQLTVCCWLS